MSGRFDVASGQGEVDSVFTVHATGKKATVSQGVQLGHCNSRANLMA